MKKSSLLHPVGAPACYVLLKAITALARPTTGGPASGFNPAAVPLDGGASLLLATGVAYGLKRQRAVRAMRP